MLQGWLLFSDSPGVLQGSLQGPSPCTVPWEGETLSEDGLLSPSPPHTHSLILAGSPLDHVLQDKDLSRFRAWRSAGCTKPTRNFVPRPLSAVAGRAPSSHHRSGSSHQPVPCRPFQAPQVATSEALPSGGYRQALPKNSLPTFLKG